MNAPRATNGRIPSGPGTRRRSPAWRARRVAAALSLTGFLGLGGCIAATTHTSSGTTKSSSTGATAAPASSTSASSSRGSFAASGSQSATSGSSQSTTHGS